MQRAIKTENISDRRNRKTPDFPATVQSPGALRERYKTVPPGILQTIRMQVTNSSIDHTPFPMSIFIERSFGKLRR